MKNLSFVTTTKKIRAAREIFTGIAKNSTHNQNGSDTIFPYFNQVLFRQQQHISCKRSLRQVHKTGSEDGLGWVMDSSLVQTAHSRISGLASVRSGRREKPAAPVAAPHDVDFRHLWRQLKTAGWTSKRPSGIQTDWTYTSAKGAVLVGERAVVEYAFQSGLLVEEQEGEEDGGEEHVGEEGGEGKHVGETGGDEEHVGEEGGDEEHVGETGGDEEHLSRNTIEQVFGPSSESEPELSQAAVARAFDLSPGDLEADDEQRDTAASLRLLSDASGLESEGEDERAVASPTAPPQRTRIPQKLNDDVNVLLDGERSSEYENLSSDESDSDGICDGDCDTGGDEFDEEDDELSDSDAAEMDEAFLASLHIGGDGGLSKAALKQRAAALRAMRWTPVSTAFETDTPSYPGLGADEARPVGELLDVWRSPRLTLLYFVPKTVWVSIARETNRYFLQRVGTRAENMAARQTGRHRETVAQISRRLKAAEKYGTHEILHVVGLLVARMLCPQKRGFAAHWSMVEEGAIPAGLFGSCVLWWTRSKSASWQVGLFQPSSHSTKAYFLPRPSATPRACSCLTSRTDTAPNCLCCATQRRRIATVYVGKRNNDGGDTGIDAKTGAAAVLRNLKTALTPQSRHNWHAVIIDRYYTSVPLAVELLKMRVYVVGTIMTNRLGFDKRIKSEHKTRPASIPRDSFLFTRSVDVPAMISCLWWDRKPVYYLRTGSVMTPSTIERKVKRVGAIQVGCPQSVKDYQNWMGGVDRHDQLRLQSYSLQMSTRFTKFYKGLFLGSLDLALVNAFLTHKEAAKIKGTVAMKRSEWFTVL
ncbi:unnamed protein product [Phytophthora fragariaefolia]|uniref:Unnamed protein product n=1 Tax=Phytophthora fragariaefolia TaxID=1490495 RepID=A0A9W7CKI7_9STRA|nr:unnamed protein product [Phytophthora fragariaefolia]